jgi:DNA-binding transcriptional ArsR family regulator
VLEDAGLVRTVQVGRERFYELEQERLRAVVGDWLAHFTTSPPARRPGSRSRVR